MMPGIRALIAVSLVLTISLSVNSYAEDEVTFESAKKLISFQEIPLAEWDSLPKGTQAVDSVDGYLARIIEDQQGDILMYLKLPGDGKAYRIMNIPLPKRMTSHLLFSDPGTLNFNRWHSPHYGWHYEIDCRNLRCVEVRAFGDSFFVRGESTQQAGSPQAGMNVNPASLPPSLPNR